MRRITKFSLLLSLVLGLYFPTVFAQSNMTNEMFDLAKLKSGVKNKRISSTDPTGGNRDHLEPFKPGEKRIIADIKGTGVINHIWVTIAPPPPTLSRNDIIIRMYWDGNDYPVRLPATYTLSSSPSNQYHALPGSDKQLLLYRLY